METDTTTDTRESRFQQALTFTLTEATDAELDRLFAAARERRKMNLSVAAAETMASLAVGDTVEVKGVSPKYLNGTRGTVAAIGQKVKVRCDLATTAPRAAMRLGLTEGYGIDRAGRRDTFDIQPSLLRKVG